MNKNLLNLKVGDEVLLNSYFHGHYIKVIDKVLPSSVVIKSQKYCKKTGNVKPKSFRDEVILRKATEQDKEDILEKINLMAIKQNIYSFFINFGVNIKKLSKEELQIIENIVKDKND